jgi:hypothetical protein
MPKLHEVSKGYDDFLEWLENIEKATPKLCGTDHMSKIKRQSMEITLLENYGNVAEWLIGTGMKMDRGKLMETFCGDEGLERVAKLKTSVETVHFETEKYRNDARVDRLQTAITNLEGVIQDILGAK